MNDTQSTRVTWCCHCKFDLTDVPATTLICPNCQADITIRCTI